MEASAAPTRNLDRGEPDGGGAPVARGGGPAREGGAGGVHAPHPGRQEPRALGLDGRRGAAAAAQGRARPGRQPDGRPGPFEAVKQAVEEGAYDEIIISTLPKQTSKWLRGNLIKRVEKLGLPVTAVVPGAQSTREALQESDDVTRNMIAM